jgi:hypothetical protein
VDYNGVDGSDGGSPRSCNGTESSPGANLTNAVRDFVSKREMRPMKVSALVEAFCGGTLAIFIASNDKIESAVLASLDEAVLWIGNRADALARSIGTAVTIEWR